VVASKHLCFQRYSGTNVVPFFRIEKRAVAQEGAEPPIRVCWRLKWRLQQARDPYHTTLPLPYPLLLQRAKPPKHIFHYPPTSNHGLRPLPRHRPRPLPRPLPATPPTLALPLSRSPTQPPQQRSLLLRPPPSTQPLQRRAPRSEQRRSRDRAREHQPLRDEPAAAAGLRGHAGVSVAAACGGGVAVGGGAEERLCAVRTRRVVAEWERWLWGK